MSTTLVFVGYLGDGEIYVNVPWKEAVKDYESRKSHPEAKYYNKAKVVTVAELEDGDTVGSYMMYGEIQKGTQ